MKIAVICVAAAGAVFFAVRNARWPAEDPDFTTRRMSFVCSDSECWTGFDVSMSEIRAATQGVRCPKCQKPAENAYQCASCGKMNRPVDGREVPPTCEFCKASMVVRDPNDPK